MNRQTATVLRFPATVTRHSPSSVIEDRAGENVVPVRFGPQARRGACRPTRAPGISPTDQKATQLSHGEIWRAIGENRIVNHYQPQYDFGTGAVVSVECLARLIDDGSLVYPDRFIARAESSGMIVALGRAVIREVCRDLARWRRQGFSPERVAINLSAHQLQLDGKLVDFIGRQLADHRLDFTDLEFELTERQALSSDGPAMSTLRSLAAAGSRLALDDFGIGYSSLAYLSTLEISTVKLDRSLIARLPEDPVVAGMVRHMLAMAHEVGADVVAEGIETLAQNEFLAELGCQLGQGYLVAKPMDRVALAQFLTI